MATHGPPTKDFVDIADIRDTVVIMKNGSLRSVIEVTSINFDLKSQEEQTGIVRGFQNFLNAVDFPLQIVINSRRLDITAYLASIESVEQTITNDLLRVQMDEYIKFIRGIAELAGIMSKKFYISIPYYVAEGGSNQKQGFFKKMTSVFAPSSFVKNISDKDFEKYKFQLDQRVALVSGTLGGLGVRVRTLEQEELLLLFNDYYNPPPMPISQRPQ